MTNFIHAGNDAAGNPVDLYYEDWGEGSPIVLIHGWPLSHEMWEYQQTGLTSFGLRTIAYDRRGFGKSSKPYGPYDYDALADDLKAVLDALHLHDVTLVGFSMGGGEVARYMSRHGGARVSRVAFVSSVTPFLLKTEDNPSGVERAVFDQMIEGLNTDRPAFLQTFGKQFFGVGLISHPVSAAALEWTQTLAMTGSPKATLDCVRSFSETDFRADLEAIKVPTLIIHGTGDATVPIASSGDETAKRLPSATYLKYDGAPHGLHLTHKDRLNADLLDFVKTTATVL